MTGMCVHCVYNACADVDCESSMKMDFTYVFIIRFESGSIKKRYGR